MRNKIFALVSFLTIGFASANTVAPKKESVTVSISNESAIQQDLQAIFEIMPVEYQNDIIQLVEECKSKIENAESQEEGKFWCSVLGVIVTAIVDAFIDNHDIAVAVGNAIKDWCNNGFK